MLKTVAGIAIAIVATLGLGVEAAYAQAAPKEVPDMRRPSQPTAMAEGSKCDCAIFPWTPEACVKSCTSRFLSLPAATLDKTLGTASYKFTIEGMQKQGVTATEVDTFLKGKEGKMFLDAVGKTDAKTLRMLATEAGKTPVNKGE